MNTTGCVLPELLVALHICSIIEQDNYEHYIKAIMHVNGYMENDIFWSVKCKMIFYWSVKCKMIFIEVQNDIQSA